jgi:ribA/ribD-fused uncharacterized protein
MAIYFYIKHDEYGDFCNFSRHGFELDGKYWLTAEYYFQAQKFAGMEFEEIIRLASTPNEAKRLGRANPDDLRKDWEAVRYEIMLKAVLRKFETHRLLRKRLLNTGDEDLVENAPHDYYWGCGQDGTGQNKLGKILMEVRRNLRGRG